MPTQRRFEGTTLAAVLAEVQKEVGADAKIESAQKVRKGGFGGFFQRERFEVVVDLDASPSAPAPGEPRPASLLDLAEAVNNSESKPDETAAAAASTVEAKPQVSAAAPAPTSSSSSSSSTSQEDFEFAGKESRISTETDSFAEVLSRVAFQADMRSPARQSEPSADNSGRPAIADRPAILDIPPAENVSAPVRTRITDSPLAKLGLPADFIPVGVEGTRMHAALVASLQRLPKAPEIHPSKGSVVVVVGERNEAIDLAKDFCDRWGQPSEDIVLASQSFKGKTPYSMIRTLRSAEDSKRSWSRRANATVVVMDAHPGSGDTAWAEQMLTALEPIATYGVANATRKAEDIAAWSILLGGIDALAVNHVDETVSPASILSAEIPVDRIDGRKASPAYWAMLLVDRLNAA